MADMVAAFRARRDYVASRLAAMPGLRLAAPAGAFYALPEVSAFVGTGVSAAGFGPVPDVDALCRYLVEHAGVALVPGDAFGAPACVRIRCACVRVYVWGGGGTCMARTGAGGGGAGRCAPTRHWPAVDSSLVERCAPPPPPPPPARARLQLCGLHGDAGGCYGPARGGAAARELPATVGGLEPHANRPAWPSSYCKLTRG